MKRKVYLAARYSRRIQLIGYADVLRSRGWEVTSRWLKGNHQISDDEMSDDARRSAKAHFATEDFEDVMVADTVISFTEEPRTTNSRGGRHVELGIALGAGKTCIVIGPHENVFHLLPVVKHFKNWPEFLNAHFGIRKEQSKSPGHPDNHALNPSDPEEESLSFQQQALLWTESTFGPESITPRIRALRFLEEALELVQSIGVDASDAATILSYVYGREPGRPDLEIGGVMLTLGALSEVLRVSMDDQAERELSRVRADTEAIKLRDQAKPKLHMLGEGS